MPFFTLTFVYQHLRSCDEFPLPAYRQYCHLTADLSGLCPFESRGFLIMATNIMLQVGLYLLLLCLLTKPIGLWINTCLLYTSPSPRDGLLSRMPFSA